MGGSCRYYNDTPSRVSFSQDKWENGLRKFFKKHDLSDLLQAAKLFFRQKEKGFILEVAKVQDIKSVEAIPKEFPDIEYEVKFTIEPYSRNGKSKEPTIAQYLAAFDFPLGGSARFINDPANNIATGTNHFFGDSLDERLVVIEKAGKIYLKEKGLVIPLSTGIPYEDIVIKRPERRYEATMAEILAKTQETMREEGIQYRGRIRKEKGDVFILDTSDGRIYSFTVTRAHLTKQGETKESEVQRQLELEYAGFIPGFTAFEKDSEQQLVQGIVDLAKYTFALYNGAPIANGWRMNLSLTSQRKYDFVLGKGSREQLHPALQTNLLEMPSRQLVPA